MYATGAELRLRLGETYQALYEALDGSAQEAEIEADLAAASAEIDGMIGCRYATPVETATAQPLLKSWTLSLAEELAWCRSGKGDLPESRKSRIAYVREKLTAVAKGEMSLPGVPEAENSTFGGMLLAESEQPVFTREQMEGY